MNKILLLLLFLMLLCRVGIAENNQNDLDGSNVISNGSEHIAEQVFIQRYVEAINAKDIKRIKSLMTPSAQACLNKGNEEYFADLFNQEFKRTIPSNYKALIRLLTSQELDQAQQRNLQGQRHGLPVEDIPPHHLEINFETGENYFSVIVKNLIWNKGTYGLDYACPSVEWLEEYRKRKNNPEEQKKYYQKLGELLEKEAQLVPLDQRQYFLNGEYGALFFKSELFPNVWKFKTKAAFRKIEIVLIGPQGEEKILVNNKFFSSGFLPLQFEFYLGDVEKIPNGQQQLLRLPYGFGRTGGFKKPEDHPYAESGSSDLQGETVKQVFINKIISNSDVLNVSDNITLAAITTQITSKDFSYGITLRVQAEGSYLLKYEYLRVDGKLTSHLSTGEQEIATYGELKTWAGNLPAGTHLTLGPGCKRLGDEILFAEKELEDFKRFCSDHKLILDIRPSG